MRKKVNMNVGFTAGLVLTGPEKERALPERRQNVIFQTCIFLHFHDFYLILARQERDWFWSQIVRHPPSLLTKLKY